MVYQSLHILFFFARFCEIGTYTAMKINTLLASPHLVHISYDISIGIRTAN